MLAGHIDTVPVAGNLPARSEDGVLHGCGSCDMKGGVAVQLSLAARLTAIAGPISADRPFGADIQRLLEAPWTAATGR